MTIVWYVVRDTRKSPNPNPIRTLERKRSGTETPDSARPALPTAQMNAAPERLTLNGSRSTRSAMKGLGRVAAA